MPSAWAIGSGTVLFIASLFFLVGFSTPAWRVGQYSEEGLWQNCQQNAFDSVTRLVLSDCISNTDNHEDWLDATRALVIIGMICLLVALLVHVIGCCSDSRRMCVLAQTAFSIAASFFITIGQIVYGSEYDSDNTPEIGLGYSYILATLGGIGCLAGGVLAGVDYVRLKNN